MSDDRPTHESRLIHGPDPSHTGAVSTPLVHSATFTFPSLDAMVEAQAAGAAGAFYQRVGHPTVHAVERRLADLEGSEDALLFPSGMAAISTTLLAHLRAGDHAVCVDPCYGGTQQFLAWGAERLGWTFTLVDAREPSAWASAFRPQTRLLHLECPINPTLTVFDIAAAAELGHRHGCVVTLDNTVASPLGQRPLELGCDLSLYSATKSIAGHSDVLAGAVMGSRERIAEVHALRKLMGPMPDPQSAWLIERSLKTMALRVRASNANALELAARLERHPSVPQVFYPGLASHPGHALAARQMRLGFGPLLGFEVRGGAEAAKRVVEGFRLIKHGASLGAVESLSSLAAYTSHLMLGEAGRARAGIPEGLVRLSAGIEPVDDLWADLEQALAAARA